MLTLVLLPGMDGTGLLFEPLIAALGDRVRIKVVTYPTAGHANYAALEAIARQALPTEGAYVILGESFSGPIAIRLAATASSQLKGLILCCSFATSPMPFLAPLRRLTRAMPIVIPPAAILGRVLLGKFYSPTLAVHLANALKRVPPATIRARLCAVLSVDARSELAVLRVPLLYLRATEDRLVPARAGHQISEINPNTRIVNIEAPHFLLQAKPTDAARIVEEFLGKTNEVNEPRS